MSNNGLFHRAVVILLALGYAPSTLSQAQPPGSTKSPPSTFHVEAPNYREIQSRFSDAVSVYQWWANIAVENALRRDISNMIKNAIAEASPLIGWADGGVLYEIRVVRSESAGENGQYLAQIVDGRATYSGMGPSAEIALFKYLKESRVSTGDPPGYAYDPFYSGFFWVERGKSGAFSATVVPRGTAYDVTKRLAANYGTVAEQFRQAELAAGERYARIAEVAKTKLRNEAARAAIDSAAKSVEASRVLVQEINSKLARAIRQAEKANNTAVALAALSKVLELTALIQQATSGVGDAKFNANDAKNPPDVISRVRTYEDQQIRIKETLEIQLQRGQEAFAKSIDAFGTTIAPANPPSQVMDDIKVRLP